MKRILSLLAAIGLTATASSAAVSCTTVHHNRGSQLVVIKGTPVFSTADVITNIDSDSWTDKNSFSNEVEITGLSFNFIPNFNASNLSIVANKGNQWTAPIVIDTADTYVTSDNNGIRVVLKGQGIKIPKDGQDTYTITYTDSKNLKEPLTVQMIVKVKNAD